jgi:hypothetical protein
MKLPLFALALVLIRCSSPIILVPGNDAGVAEPDRDPQDGGAPSDALPAADTTR